jgi:hypothetical protein
MLKIAKIKAGPTYKFLLRIPLSVSINAGLGCGLYTWAYNLRLKVGGALLTREFSSNIIKLLFLLITTKLQTSYFYGFYLKITQSF